MSFLLSDNAQVFCFISCSLTAFGKPYLPYGFSLITKEQEDPVKTASSI